jgi:hypothetical protein
MASQRISVRVPRQMAQRLKRHSQVTGAHESDVVREALEKYLAPGAEGPTAYDLALKSGLIGCARGAPKDLSTNKKYFKGFGTAK